MLTGSVESIFDDQFALNQFSGNQSLLLKILEKFINQYQNVDILLLEYMQQEDFQAVKKEVHTIKGVSGNLGMKALHQECKNLEENFAVSPNEHSLNAFIKVLKDTLALIQNYPSDGAIDKSSIKVPEEDGKALLIAALKRNEFISESKMQKFEPSLNLSTEKLTELKQAIDNLDYVSAMQMLE